MKNTVLIFLSYFQHTQTRLSTNILRDVGQIFVSFKIVIYFCWCVLVGLGTALIWNFLFWHLEDLASLQEGFVKLALENSDQN